MFPSSLFVLQLVSAIGALATPLIYDGRAPLNYTAADFDRSLDPYLTVVKGSQNASHYTQLLGSTSAPTPLWNKLLRLPNAATEQVIAVSIDNSSVFVPGGNPQFGFRRTDIIAEKNFTPSNLLPQMESGKTVFHFSIQLDQKKPLNFNHEYQIVFIEPTDGSHVFGIQLGSPFTIPTGQLPAANAHNLEVLDHGNKLLFSTPFTPVSWHNFAVQVDWDQNTLAVFYSKDATQLKAVTKALPNPTHPTGAAGQGEFHFGIIKLPLANPADSAANQGDVVHHGIQEGTTEGLLYSGVFVEGVQNGISLGGGRVSKKAIQ
jgi:hypothetical protein